ncbi:MAG: phytanoyl-CoA dioxygenase family protein [Pseudonocardiaceae bacterium]
MTTSSVVSGVADAVRGRGAAVVPNFLTGDRLASLKQHADDLLSGTHALRFPKSTRVWDLYRHGPPFVDLLMHRQLSELIAELLGENYLLSDYSLNAVNPHQPQDDWHLDYPFNEMTALVQGGLLGVQCVLTLDEFTNENGATQYLPGSHRPARRPDPSATRACTTIAAPAGSLLIMAASTWHRSGYNSTRRARAGVLLSFIERWIRPMTDPPEPGLWSATPALRLLLGMERPPETINGLPIDGTDLP